MPELPDLTVYVEALTSRVVGRRIERVRLADPFIVRTADPPLAEIHGRLVMEVRRLGKRLVFGLEGDLFLLMHLMIAGRLRWRAPQARIPGKVGLAAFDFPHGTLLLTEASSKRRAALHVVRGAAHLEAYNPGGIEPLEADLVQFSDALLRERHMVKRALTDPRLFSGIGNAYSDEILHRARLSPVKFTNRLEAHEIDALFRATRAILTEWIERLRCETGEEFPETVTAFREGMAVHGCYGRACPVCGAPVQRIVYAENETNYCATCQTGGRLLADRSLSRLLHTDWPKTVDELEQRKQRERNR